MQRDGDWLRRPPGLWLQLRNLTSSGQGGLHGHDAVGWMVAPREPAALAERLITASCDRQGILLG